MTRLMDSLIARVGRKATVEASCSYGPIYCKNHKRYREQCCSDTTPTPGCRIIQWSGSC